MWTWGRKSRKQDNLRYDDFMMPKFPVPTTAYHGVPYYQQMPSAFPTYYAPVLMPPYGMQQPMVAMPQGYVPMATYPTAIQPGVVPAPAIAQPAMQMPAPAVIPNTQPAPAIQMPAPATAPTPAPVPVPAPVPPATAQSLVPPPNAPSRMPQPYSTNEPNTRGPVIPRTPVIAEPVIPSPPVTNYRRSNTLASDLYRRPSQSGYPPDSDRPRFTDFYRRPTDPPPRPPSVNEPVRPSVAGQPGRTPFNGSVPMPMPDVNSTSVPMPHPDSSAVPMPQPDSSTIPMPLPGRSANPLPPPPADVWDTSPYREVLHSLRVPNEPSDLFDVQPCSDVHVGMPEPEPPRSSSRFGGLFGLGSSRDKGKKPLRGLFRSRSTTGPDVTLGDVGSSSGSRHGHARAQTMTSIYMPAPDLNASSSSGSSSGASMPVPSHGPPIKFDHTGEFAGFVNHSNHRVMYKNKMYPTALHLLEAMKFTHKPELQERIRTCKDVNDMYPLSAGFQEHVRPDWGQVFLQTMEDVLYFKFKQHPGLRALLLRTGLVDIVYADENVYWGEGPAGEGANELGKALVRVRDRLRQEGER